MSKTTDQGQRVDNPAAVTGDSPVRPEKDEQALKEDMRKAEDGSDIKLHKAERDAAENVRLVPPDHRQNDAGQ
ncbi:hypothetical protein [Variovorax boronicumulans]|uniref:hypothetical protein n=1 Tax=Variovorax boronicumulans TaxID=436515 RepID=UPI001C59788D